MKLDLDLAINEAQLAVCGRQHDARCAPDTDLTPEQRAAQAVALHDAFSLLWLISRNKDLQKVVRVTLEKHLEACDHHRVRLAQKVRDASSSAECSEAQGATRPGASAGHQHDGGESPGSTSPPVSETKFSEGAPSRR